MELLSRMNTQGAHTLSCRKALSNVIQRHEKAFANLGKKL